MKQKLREFPGSPVVSTWHSHCLGLGSIPGQGNEILEVSQHSQKKKKNGNVVTKNLKGKIA